jgi:hypothetical protein
MDEGTNPTRFRGWLLESRVRYFAVAASIWIVLHLAVAAIRSRLDALAVVAALVGGLVVCHRHYGSDLPRRTGPPGGPGLSRRTGTWMFKPS